MRATHAYGGRGRRGGSDPYDGFGCNLPIGKRQGTGGCSPPTSRYAADSAGRYGPGRSGYLSCVLQPVGPLGPLRDDSLGIGPGQDLKVGGGMRVLILGASAMLGHTLWQVFRDRFETWGTVRSSYEEYARYDLFDAHRLLGGIGAADFYTVVRAFEIAKPDVVINTIGIIKQLPAAKDPIASIAVNSLFSHRLARLCQATSARLIHISTDCVFSGRKGMYTEDDVPDPEDLYDRSKLLGEVAGPACLTFRTSFIGRELPISKYHLLCLMGEAFRFPSEIEPFPDLPPPRDLLSLG